MFVPSKKQSLKHTHSAPEKVHLAAGLRLATLVLSRICLSSGSWVTKLK